MGHPSLNRTSHRPWGLPEAEWRWRQSWCDLLFAHWPVDAALLKPLVPAPLQVQEFDGTSWVGIVPFRMEGVMLRYLPDLPWISAFPELNVRLYVEYEGKPGVWFLSLDAANLPAVHAARRFFHLPYFHASMKIANQANGFQYRSKRKEGRQLEFEAYYEPSSEPYEAKPETLEHWLAERYCLYAQDKRGNLYRGEVHHAPWPLQRAKAEIPVNQMMLPHGITLQESPTLLHFASRLDVIIWPLQRLAV